MSQPRPVHAVATDPDSTRTATSRRRASAPDEQRSVATRRAVDPWLAGAIAVTVLGLGLRLTGIWYGLPDHFHWDEPTIMNRVIRMGGGDLDPHFFYYPTLLMYALLVANGLLFAVGR